jgi:hypothetical protein
MLVGFFWFNLYGGSCEVFGGQVFLECIKLPLVFQYATLPFFRIGFIFFRNHYLVAYLGTSITNLLNFISLFKFCVKFDFHRFVKNSYFILC